MKGRAIRTWTNKETKQVVSREFCVIDHNKCTPKPKGTNRAELRRAAKLASK